MRKVLLDTNAYVRYLAGDERVLEGLGSADRVYMSVFVLGELFAGFKAGKRPAENRRILERFLDKPSVRVLEASRETAEVFGALKDTLKRSGRPIPMNDVWIAAQALETGAVLVTYDGHFRDVPGLRLWEEASGR
jgi:tRNA(fMet)-specific endonuclease VapC